MRKFLFSVGLRKRCYDYGSLCYEYNDGDKFAWFYCATVLLNLTLELLNVLLLWKRTRARINLILGNFGKKTVRNDSLFVHLFVEELSLLATLIFLVPACFLCLFGVIHSMHSKLDWSFFIFYIASAIALIDFICSIVRVVSIA